MELLFCLLWIIFGIFSLSIIFSTTEYYWYNKYRESYYKEYFIKEILFQRILFYTSMILGGFISFIVIIPTIYYQYNYIKWYYRIPKLKKV